MRRSSVIAVLRISRRNVGRNRWRSALIVLLVLLPVAGMSAAITVLRTTTPTPEARATAAMGVADLLVSRRTSLASTEDLRSVLPDGSRVEEITWVDTRLNLPGRQLRVTERALDLTGLAQGMLTLVSGRLPEQADEIAITPSTQAAAELGIGDTLDLADGGRASIVGVVENPASVSQRLVLRHSSLAGDPRNAGDMTWLVSIPAGVHLPETLEGAMNDVPSPDLGSDYQAQTRGQWGGGLPASATAGTLLIGALALIETVLVASAAFAVSIRRRQRELGILAASGAQPRHLAGTVIGEGLVLGGLAAVLGAVLGLATTIAMSPWFDGLNNRRNPPVSIDFGGLALAAGVGLVAALLAAAIPAWSAARLPVLLALSGRRPPLGRARRILALGLVLVGAAIALEAAGAALSFDYSRRDLGVALLAVGAIVGVLGFGACSPWLVERLEGIGRRLPTSARIAFRDTARARSRSAPIVTAMLSGMAATIAIAGFAASYSAKTQADWKPMARADQLIVYGDDAPTAGAAVAAELDGVGAPSPTIVGPDESEASVQVRWSVIGPDAPAYLAPDSEWDYASRATTGDATLLHTLAADKAADALGAGKVVVLTQDPRDIDEVLVLVDRFDPLKPEVAVTTEEYVLPAEAVAVGIDPEWSIVPGAVLPAALVAQLNLAPSEGFGNFIVRLDHAATEADLSRAGALVAAYGDTWLTASTGPDRTADVLRWVAMALSLLLALSVTAIAVALGEAESRSDQRTLLALGAAPGIRRRIAAARAGVLAVLAGVLAIPAGLLPAWGLLASREIPLIAPVNEIMVAAIVLPLTAIAGALILSRPIPAWSAFRN